MLEHQSALFGSATCTAYAIYFGSTSTHRSTPFSYRHSDDAFLADLLHCLGNEIADLALTVCTDSANLEEQGRVVQFRMELIKI